MAPAGRTSSGAASSIRGATRCSCGTRSRSKWPRFCVAAWVKSSCCASRKLARKASARGFSCSRERRPARTPTRWRPPATSQVARADQSGPAVGDRSAQDERLRPLPVERLGLHQQAVTPLQEARATRDVAGGRQRVGVLAGLLSLLQENPRTDAFRASFLLAQHELFTQAATQKRGHLLRERVAQLQRVAPRMLEAAPLDVRSAGAID